MLKKSWTLRISICVAAILTANNVRGQANFNITSGNITQASLTVDNATTVYTAPLVALAPTITLKSTTGGTLTKTGGGIGVPVGLFSAKIIGTGGSLLNVLGTTPTITLSSTPQSIYTSALTALPSGALNFRYTLSGINSTTWLAGSYTSDLTFAASAVLTSPGTLSPTVGSLNLNVAAFITAVGSPSGIQLTVNSLDFYRSSTLSGTYSVATTTTVPYGIRVKNNASTFTYSNGYSGATDPNTATTLMTGQITAPSAGTAISGGTSFANLATGLAVPTNNAQTSTVTLSIKPADLKTGFVKKGTYTTNVSYEVFDSQTAPQATTQAFSCPLTITVNDLSELKVNQTDINLTYTTSADYTNGIFADANGHITLSNTNPYDVYVKASSSTLTNGANTLPVGVITISPTPASAGSFSTVSLSATAQKIISASTPIIDRSLNVRYAIPASKSSQLLGKPAGTYNTVVTYSLIAP